MLNRRLLLSAVALAVVAVTTSNARADILIDDFSLPVAPSTYAIGPDANPLVINTNLGGGLTRAITLTVTAPTPAPVNGLTGGVGAANGGLFSASFNVASSGTVSIVYNYAETQNFDPNNFLGSLRFRGAGDPGFAPDIPLVITIVTATGNRTFNGSLPLTPVLTDVDIALSAFTGPGDFTQVNGVTINMTGGQAADFIFDALSVNTPQSPPPAVPAPPAAFLVLAALPALGAWRMVKARKTVAA